MSLQQLNDSNSNSTCGPHCQWETRLEVARLAYENGLYAAASRNYQRVIAEGDGLGLTDQDMSAALLGLAKCYCALGKFAKAEVLYKRLLEIDETAVSSQNWGLDKTAGQRTNLAMDFNDLALLYLKT